MSQVRCSQPAARVFGRVARILVAIPKSSQGEMAVYRNALEELSG